MEYSAGEDGVHELTLLDASMVTMFLCMLTPGQLLLDWFVELTLVKMHERKVHILRGSWSGRSRRCRDVGITSFVPCWDIYEDKGRAGYDDVGPGIRRLSAAVVIFCSNFAPHHKEFAKSQLFSQKRVSL